MTPSRGGVPASAKVQPVARAQRDANAPRGDAYDVTVQSPDIGKRINCVCGKIVEGRDDDELWERAQEHLAADHPDLVGKVSREDILAQAEDI